MPNRIIKESICTSEEVDKLSNFEEIVFYRLIVNCDDFGRFDGRLSVLKSRLFPLRIDRVREDTIEKALQKLELANIVQRYTVSQRPYLQLQTWEKHQSIRAKKSKYPGPNEADKEPPEQIGNHLQADDCKCPRNPIQSESNPIRNAECMHGAETAPCQPPVITLLLNNGDKYEITNDHVMRWTELYPAVDVMQELRKMAGWLEGNPTRRKTARGIMSFATNWLSKEQDKGRASIPSNGRNQVQSSAQHEHSSSFLQGDSYGGN